MRWDLVAAFATAGMLTLASVLIIAFIIHRKTRVPWLFWVYGAAVFFVFQGILRIPWFVALEFWLRETLKTSSLLFLAFVAFAAFTAGLFERGGQWLLFRYLIKPKDRTPKTALMVGAGHGGLEALAFGTLVSFATLIGYITLQTLPLEALKGPEQEIAQLKTEFAQMAWWIPFLNPWERLSAQGAQIGLTMMVWRSFQGSFWWFPTAILAHTLLDFSALVSLHFATKAWGKEIASLVTETLITLYALALVWVARKLWQMGVK